MHLASTRKIMALAPLPPAAGGTGLRQKDDGGRLNGPRHQREKNMAARTSPPPRPEETGLRRKDDGGRLDAPRHRREKNYGSRSSPPARRRKRDSGKRTMGVGSMHSPSTVKDMALGPLPPGRRKRDSGKRTMGVGLMDLTIDGEKAMALAPLPPSAVDTAETNGFSATYCCLAS